MAMFKRYFMLLVLSVLFILPINAGKSDKLPAVSMVSYEQSWLDIEGTLALKNNTKEYIYSVDFRMTYFDMSGNQIDYADFSKPVDIAPGMTRKINVPSYEHDRNYHYYKTKDEFNHPAFKVDFELLDYNKKVVSDDEYLDKYSFNKDYATIGLWLIFGIIIALGITVGLFVLVAVMAQKRNRSVVIWLLLSMIASPLLMVIILLFIGDADRREF